MILSLLFAGDTNTYILTIVAWAIVIVASLIVEFITDELTIIWGTVGAVCTLIAAILKAPIWAQFIIFFVTTGLFILLTRPIIKKYNKKEKSRTNADRIIGMVGVISEGFKDLEVGKVVVNGQTWRAASTSNEEFVEGEKVQIEGFSGTKAIVSKIENKENIIRL